jgi:hypothetical protein
VHDRLAIKNLYAKGKGRLHSVCFLSDLWPFSNHHCSQYSLTTCMSLASTIIVCLLSFPAVTTSINYLYLKAFVSISLNGTTCQCLMHASAWCTAYCSVSERIVTCFVVLTHENVPPTFWCSWTSSQKSLLLLILSCMPISTCKVLPSISFLLNYCVLKSRASINPSIGLSSTCLLRVYMFFALKITSHCIICIVFYNHVRHLKKTI